MIRSQSLRWLCLLIVVFSVFAADISPIDLPYSYGLVRSCGTQYRDSSSFKCRSCPTNQEIDPSTLGGDGQYSGCRCRAGFASVEVDCSGDNSGNCNGLTCTNCVVDGLAAYSDRSGCVACDDSTLGLSTSLRDCACPAQSILVERDVNGALAVNKSCVACAAGTAVVTRTQYIAGNLYTANRYACQSCPDAHMRMTVTGDAYTCACTAGYTLVGVSGIGNQSCVLTTLTNARKNQAAAASRVTYYDSGAAGTITSTTFEHYYLQAVSKCMFSGTPSDVAYCQQLANLCVLQLYDRTSQACLDHLTLVQARSTVLVNSLTNWVTGMPWLYFGGSDANSLCTTHSYLKRMTLSGTVVQYVLAGYYMNGTFAGYEPLSTQLAYCGRNVPYTNRGGGTSRSTNWLFFGTNNKESFSCSLDTLLTKEQLFYELFIYRQDQSYTPVPVRITNLANTAGQTNAKYPTVPLCESGDVLTRRFFLYDVASGITAINSANQPVTSVIRYASYISLEASLVTDKFARIYAPVLTITYAEVKPAGWSAGPTARVELGMAYTMNTDEFFANFQVFFIIVMVFTGLLFALRFRNWQIRNARVVTNAVLTTDLGGFNMSTILEMCLYASSTWVLVFFPVTVCIAWYAFTFFKIQTAPSVLLPPERDIYSPDSPYYLFVVNLHVMFFFQLANVLVLVYRQCRADLFFIDWEPLPTKQAPAVSGSSKGSVSVWRTILVANEWTELQTVRKTDIRFTLFFLGFVLLGMGEEYNATHQPALEDKSEGHLNILLRFANTTFYWLLLSYGQYAFKFFLSERYFGEPPERLFVDFCTIAKISVIVLDERYHGYYLHCRSPHQFADGTMTELVSMLHKEEAGLTVDRSLEGAPPDVQTFQIFMSGEWREAFDKINGNLIGAQSMAEVMNDNRNRTMTRAQTKRAGGGTAGRSSAMTAGAALNNLPSEKVLKAWREMLVFLQEFVDNNFGKAALRRVVREPTYYEKLTNSGPELAVTDQPSVFFTDRDFNYCKVLFLGRELELLTLDILAYSLFDVWFNHTCTSILLTYLLDQAVCYVRHYVGQVMISRKTLIDNRFLI